MIDVILAAVLTASPTQMECLAKNIYFESRNQSHLGQIAVAHVTLNRLVDDRYPSTVCDVVQQGVKNSDGSMKKHMCQFSWYCDGLPDKPRNEDMWIQSWSIAREAVDLYNQGIDITRGATHYHAENVYPNWAPTLDKVMRVDDHIFYRWN